MGRTNSHSPRTDRADARHVAGRAALGSFDVFEILDKSPQCVIVIDEQAAIVYQNAASRELDVRMRAGYGEALLDAVRTVLPSLDTGPGHGDRLLNGESGQAHADMTVDRFAGGFVVSWSDQAQSRARAG